MPTSCLPTISILVATLHAPSSLDVLLQSLCTQQWQPGDEVIFVDNSSNARHEARIKALFSLCEEVGLRARYVSEKKTGLIHARVAGFQYLSNDWVFLLDDDNSLASHSIERLRKRLSEHPELGGICPRIDPVWAHKPALWIEALGHDILSYNHSSLNQFTPDWSLWSAAKKKRRPPGGGMMICRKAIDKFLFLIKTKSEITTLGHTGAYLGSGEDYLLYEQIYELNLCTAYDASILVYHHIPPQRLTVRYLFQLIYGANFGFGRVALILKGKLLFPASLGHACYRLLRCLLFYTRYSCHPLLLMASVYAFFGYCHGTWFQLTQRSR